MKQATQRSGRVITHLMILCALFTGFGVSADPHRIPGKQTISIHIPSNFQSFSDSCCGPDSLKVISVNRPLFCVSWQIPSDSSCIIPGSYEIQWRLLGTLNWMSKVVTYTSGTTITFCDTADCGSYAWRVRSVCNDSTFSDWVNGPKFTMICEHDFSGKTHGLSIFPNPGRETLFIGQKHLSSGWVTLMVTDITGTKVLSRKIYLNGNMNEKLSIGSWREGTYYVRIQRDGKTLSQGIFLKKE